MSTRNTIKLYVVRIEREFVFASTASTIDGVSQQAERAYRRGEIEDDSDDDLTISPLSYLPGGYDKDSIPYGDGDGDKTIGDYIAGGGAPDYVKMQEQLEAAHRRTGRKVPT